MTRLEIYVKHRANKDSARIAFEKARRTAQANFNVELALCQAWFASELAKLPPPEPKETNVESLERKTCVSCSKKMLAPTKENAETLVRVRDYGKWQHALAGLRSPIRKYCCYHCKITKGRVHGNYCTLPESVAR